MMEIRAEQPEDIRAVRAVNEQAFGQRTEARIIDEIRAACPEVVSLVARDAGQIVGHIFFSPVRVTGSDGSSSAGMGLGPMAVVPERQRQGIGSHLVKTGIEVMEEGRCPFVVVVGHADYYPRFGFQPASRYGLSCQWEGIPDDVFMVRVLDPAVMAEVFGTVRYRKEFDRAT